MLQSVLVTVDRHEWYAPPQIYTRDDCTGLWISQPAFQPEASPLSSNITKSGQSPESRTIVQDSQTHSEVDKQSNGKGSGNDITRMETSDDVFENQLSWEVSNMGTKKRRVKDEISSDGIVSADTHVHETEEAKLEGSGTLEDEILRDYQGATDIAANASFAERVIEPTLVMFEVYSIFYCLLLPQSPDVFFPSF